MRGLECNGMRKKRSNKCNFPVLDIRRLLWLRLMIVWIWMFQLRGMTLVRGRCQVCACSHFSAKATKGYPTEFLSPVRAYMGKPQKELKCMIDTTPDLDNLKELGSRTLQNTQELCIGFVK